MYTQAFLIESLNGVQTIKAQNAERWWLALAAPLLLVHERNFRTMLIGVSTGTAGQFLNQLTGCSPSGGRLLSDSGGTDHWSADCFPDYFRLRGGSLLNLATSWQTFKKACRRALERVVDARTEVSPDEVISAPPIAGE